MVNASIFQLLVSAFLLCFLTFEPAHATKKSYIVYLGSHYHGPNPSPADLESATNSHYKLLGSVLGSHDKAKEAIFYSYNSHINGFAAVLEEQEAAEIARNPNVVSVFLNKVKKLHTTRSWQFLGLERHGIVSKDSTWVKARYGEDTIIGNLDSGVWPESKSFSDEGMGPIPSKWRGICQMDNSSCNRKLIGARVFNKGYEANFGKLNNTSYSARDTEGHGSHTLSTAGGNFVQNVSVFGNGNGTAKGGSPKARVAAYKVCWPTGGCLDADVLAGFEAAISDGVDVLSVSLGGPPGEFSEDSIAIGSFHAVSNGIVVVSSAGNEGSLASVCNVSPWMLTVAASTIDRDFTSYVALGDKKYLMGESLSSTSLPSQEFYPLISSEDAKFPESPPDDAKICFEDTLDPNKVKGKIVVCLRGGNGGTEKGNEASLAGAIGMILANDENSGNELIADAHVLPASNVNFKDGEYIYSYIRSTKNPVGNMTSPKTELRNEPAPFMTSFSSRGPNSIQPSILKPDITAPGLNIIAAFSEDASPSYLDSDKRRVPFTAMSGTSMSCPHVAGVVGLLKTLHPDWSPAAIKSAIMTTASTIDDSGRPIIDAFQQEATPFSYGSGHIQPDLAMDPGLVYNLTIADHLNLLCAYNYTQEQLQIIYNKTFTCPNSYNMVDFNYPSITVLDLGTEPVNVTREVTNVGSPSTYQVQGRSPNGVYISVEPSSLTFKEIGEKHTFNVILTATSTSNTTTEYMFGELWWSDGTHKVTSPIVVKYKE